VNDLLTRRVRVPENIYPDLLVELRTPGVKVPDVPKPKAVAPADVTL
jgi:hypothetical protein